MTEWKSADDILDFAIDNEQHAIDFYRELAAKATKPEVRDLFEEYATEEVGHKTKLEAVKAGKKLNSLAEKVIDLKLSEYLVDVEPTSNLDYQSALIIAMKREKAAFRLYSKLAARLDGELRELFLRLAQEEAKHKLHFEIEYDEHILTEN